MLSYHSGMVAIEVVLALSCCSIKAKPDGPLPPGTPITVTAKVRRNQAPVAAVTLLARINYTPEQRIPMAAEAGAGMLKLCCSCWQDKRSPIESLDDVV